MEKNIRTANVEKKVLSDEWDKTFPRSDRVDHSKVTLETRFGITLAADMYVPKNAKGRLPAIAVSGPFGAVKEQCSGLYAQILAERGYVTVAFDPSFTGESGGEPKYVSSPDINTEDFQAAVDFLMLNELVDPDRVGILGICGWGGIALNAAAIDTRIKATVASTMYDMSRVNAYGYFDSTDEDARYEIKKALNAQRLADKRSGIASRAGGVKAKLNGDEPFFVKDYHEYYKVRAYHPRSLNSNDGWSITSSLSWTNAKILRFTNEIRSAVMVVHGEKAHSLYFGKDAYAEMVRDGKYTDNKELLIVPGAVHTDLYDNISIIPFDKIDGFFKRYLV